MNPAVRNLSKGEEVKADIVKKFPQAKLDVIKCDLLVLSTVLQFAKDFVAKGYKSLDYLINNAGTIMKKLTLALGSIPEDKLSDDGFEIMFQANCLGHFYLTNLLLPLSKQSPRPRVVNITSNLSFNSSNHLWNAT